MSQLPCRHAVYPDVTMMKKLCQKSYFNGLAEETFRKNKGTNRLSICAFATNYGYFNSI